MRNERPIVKLYIGSVFAAAGFVTLWTWLGAAPSLSELWTLLVLAVCAGVAHWFPIKSSSDGVSFRLTNIFIIAGAVLLPPTLMAPLAFFAVAPDVWQRRHRGWNRVLLGLVFNFGQTALAAYAASAWITWFDALQLTSFAPVRDLPSLAGGALAFTIAQELLVAGVIALTQNIPLHRVSTFTTPALLGNALVAVLGVVVSGLWLAKPVLLLVLPPIFFITHRLTRNAHLAHLAQVDVKTGLHNYRHFEAVLEEELAHSHAARRPLALLFIDIDHFKKVNDTYGHASGDIVLRDLSTLVSGMVRKGDLVARFGGEEFVVLLPGTDVDEASYLGERIRATTEAQPFLASDGRVISCTVSVGVAGFPNHATSFTTLLEAADTAMYIAKRTRNAVARAGIQAARPGPTPRTTPLTPAARVAQAATAAAGPAAVSASPPAPPKSSRLVPLVLWGTVLSAAAVLSWSLATVVGASLWLALAPILVGAVAAELFKINIYEAGRQQRISFTFGTVVSMAAMAINPAFAALSELSAALTHVVISRQRNPIKLLFNLANPTLSAAAAAGAYAVLRPDGEGFTPWHLVAALAAVVAYYVVNFGTLSLMISLHSGQPLLGVLRETVWYGPIKIFLALMGAYLGGAHGELGWLAVAMFALPLLIMRFTLSFYASKTQRHIETLQAAKYEVEAVNTEKEEMLRKLIETVALIIDARDNSVSGHSRRVAKFAVAIGKELGMNTADLAVLHTAGLFHDLGKVGIPESILHKPAKLTADEYTVIKEHAALGQRILSEVPQLADIARMVGEHHERYDGFGYPLGLAAGQISLGGRILVVTDALETILADRPYARGRDLREALDELERCAGTQFDPDVVAAVQRAVVVQGPEFFAGGDRMVEHNWGAADQILAQVFA